MVKQLYTWLYQCDFCNYAHTVKNTDTDAHYKAPDGWVLHSKVVHRENSVETRYWHLCAACVLKHGTDFIKAEIEKRG